MPATKSTRNTGIADGVFRTLPSQGDGVDRLGYWHRGATDGGPAYEITHYNMVAEHCTCDAHRFSREHVCKHMTAANAWMAAHNTARWQPADHDAPPPMPADGLSDPRPTRPHFHALRRRVLSAAVPFEDRHRALVALVDEERRRGKTATRTACADRPVRRRIATERAQAVTITIPASGGGRA